MHGQTTGLCCLRARALDVHPHPEPPSRESSFNPTLAFPQASTTALSAAHIRHRARHHAPHRLRGHAVRPPASDRDVVCCALVAGAAGAWRAICRCGWVRQSRHVRSRGALLTLHRRSHDVKLSRKVQLSHSAPRLWRAAGRFADLPGGPNDWV